MARLGDIFEAQITGEWGNECAENETGTKVLRTTNFTPDGMINFDNVVLRRITESKVEKKRLRYGDIILEKSGGTEKTPVGRVVFCDELIEDDTYLCNNFTQAMRVNQKVGCSRYVFYFMWYLHYSGKTDLLQNKTTGIRNLQVNSYLDEEIPLPPLEEQRRIAALLDKVSDLIAKRRAQLDKLDLLVKARFVEMFGDPLRNTKGWHCLELTKVCKSIFGGGTPSKSHPEYFVGTVPWVSPKDMKQAIISDSIDHITEEAIANSTTNLVPVNSVLMVIRSGILKHTLPVAINSVPVAINQDMKAFVPNSNILTEFLMYYFKAIEPDVLAGVRGVTADNIDFKAFQKRKIIIPPLKVQKEYAIFVQCVDKSKLTIHQSLDKLETLKKALMQQYFG